jgi:hypothetical protein
MLTASNDDGLRRISCDTGEESKVPIRGYNSTIVFNPFGEHSKFVTRCQPNKLVILDSQRLSVTTPKTQRPSISFKGCVPDVFAGGSGHFAVAPYVAPFNGRYLHLSRDCHIRLQFHVRQHDPSVTR